MAFDKGFFENMSELLSAYCKHYPCGVVTVTVKAYDQEYNLVSILRYDDSLLTFAYYSEEKSRQLSKSAQERTGESKAWPALTVPYEAILWVEFNPGKADGESQIGFKLPLQTSEPGQPR